MSGKYVQHEGRLKSNIITFVNLLNADRFEQCAGISKLFQSIPKQHCVDHAGNLALMQTVRGCGTQNTMMTNHPTTVHYPILLAAAAGVIHHKLCMFSINRPPPSLPWAPPRISHLNTPPVDSTKPALHLGKIGKCQ